MKKKPTVEKVTVSIEAIESIVLFLRNIPMSIPLPDIGWEEDEALTLEWYSAPYYISFSFKNKKEIAFIYSTVDATGIGTLKYGKEWIHPSILKIIMDVSLKKGG